jgi:predicted enzyme related to lactoylglutathione lyase
MTSTTEQAVTPVEHLHGHFYFADLKTTDVQAACDFYGGLFGWRFTQVEGSRPPYMIATIDGRSKAAIACAADELAQRGEQPHWFSYLTVDDLDAAVAKVPGLSGQVHVQPFDVMALGRMAVISDPTGARHGLWEDKVAATTVFDEHGSPFWNELHSSDVDASLAFYEQLAGWTPQPNEMGPDLTYYVMETPQQGDPDQVGAGGMMQRMRDDMASTWTVYFNVDDADATAATAVELGGSLMMEPHDIPGVGRSTWIIDPTGASFAAMTPLPRAAT